MAYKKRTCYLCGEQYEYCPNCSEFQHLPYYMQTFHSENCKTIFQTCVDYNMKLITKKQAMNILSQCDLSQSDKFMESVRRDLKTIMHEPKKKPSLPLIIEENMK